MIEISHIFSLLYEIHQKHPELRVCQILSISANLAGWGNDDLFYCPDSVILKGFEIFKQREVNGA